MAIFQIWRDNSGITCAEIHTCLMHFARGLIENNAELLHTFEARTPLEMCKIRNELLEHGEYHPMLNSEGEIEEFYFEEFDY